MHRLAKASLHVKRNLSVEERATIAVALELLARHPADDELSDVRCVIGNGETLLSDANMRALGHELYCARKVKVCRSKTSNA